MSTELFITDVSPVFRSSLILAANLGVTKDEAWAMLAPYAERGPDGLWRFRDDAAIPAELATAMTARPMDGGSVPRC